MSILELFAGRKNPRRIRLKKSEEGNGWIVKMGARILYTGTKRKCEKYLENALLM